MSRKQANLVSSLATDISCNISRLVLTYFICIGPYNAPFLVSTVTSDISCNISRLVLTYLYLYRSLECSFFIHRMESNEENVGDVSMEVDIPSGDDPVVPIVIAPMDNDEEVFVVHPIVVTPDNLASSPQQDGAQGTDIGKQADDNIVPQFLVVNATYSTCNMAMSGNYVNLDTGREQIQFVNLYNRNVNVTPVSTANLWDGGPLPKATSRPGKAN